MSFYKVYQNYLNTELLQNILDYLKIHNKSFKQSLNNIKVITLLYLKKDLAFT